MMTGIKQINENTYEIPEEYTYLKAEISEIWTPHIVIAKNVSNMDFYSEKIIKVIVNGEKWTMEPGYPWMYQLICKLKKFVLAKKLMFFMNMPYLDKWAYESLVLVSLNDLKDKKPGDIIIQKNLGENNIFAFCPKYIFYPAQILDDFVRFYIDQLYNTISTKEFPYLKIYVTLRSAELSFKLIKNDLYQRVYDSFSENSELISKINESLNKDENEYIVKYFLLHFKEDDYLKKEFFEKRDIIELYNVLEPIRFSDCIWVKPLKPPKDPYRDIQKLKKKIEKDLKDSLIYKAIRSYNFSIK